MTGAERVRAHRARKRRAAERATEGLAEAVAIVSRHAPPACLTLPAPVKVDDGLTLIGRRVAPVGSLLKSR